MGSRGPKRVKEDGEGNKPFDELINTMADVIEDAIYGGSTQNDQTLAVLLNIVINSIKTERPVFSNPLDEPVLYREIVYIVKDALKGYEEVRRIEEEEKRKVVGEG